MENYWEKYWKTREENFNSILGKKQVLDLITNILKTGFNKPLKEIRILDIGCGDGYALNYLKKNCNDLQVENLWGLDKNCDVLDKAKSKYGIKNLLCVDLNKSWSIIPLQFDIVFSINTFHEVFSEIIRSDEAGVDLIEKGKKKIKEIIKILSNHINPNGYLILFDGVESDSPESLVRFKLVSEFAENAFIKFCKEYKAISINCQCELINRNKSYMLTLREFTRFITKFKWINSELWDIEKLESYQYFTNQEFIETIQSCDLNVFLNDKFISDIDLWRQNISIIDKNINYPWEHILITAKK